MSCYLVLSKWMVLLEVANNECDCIMEESPTAEEQLRISLP